MKRPVDFGDPKDWPGLLPGFENASNHEEREIAQLEPAWGKAATFFRTGFRFGHPRGSIRAMSLEQVHRHLDVYRGRYEAGNTLAVLQAIGLCAEENLPLPEWVALVFQARMKAFLHPGKLHSLDQVFRSKNVPTGSPKKAAAARQDWNLGGRLYHDVWEIVQKDEKLLSFDSAVEHLLASADYGVRKTKAKALITMIEVSQLQFLGRGISLSRFLWRVEGGVRYRRRSLPWGSPLTDSQRAELLLQRVRHAARHHGRATCVLDVLAVEH